ncbi:C-C chemokine receptor type 10 [Hyperolius riggenbachi]|uniref:C-C chemokine receptor type 10 n=1 Tax=Hyperolius riggenbachi TaxID=752182 RepID=UPI0035A3CDC5
MLPNQPHQQTLDGNLITTDFYTSPDYEIPGICEASVIAEFSSIFQPLVQTLVFLIGISGNILVLLTYGFARNLKSMTDTYLINLAVADLLQLMTLPFWSISAVKSWVFGNMACKLVQGMYSINFFSGFLFLTCISVDRYCEIVLAVTTHKRRHRSIFYSKLISPVVWIISTVLSLPEFIYSQSKDIDGSNICKMIFPEEMNTVKIVSSFFQIVLGFIVPFLVMTVCYSKIIRTLLSCKSFEKHKAMKVIISVVVVFVIFQLPYTLVTFIDTADFIGDKEMSCEVKKQKDIAIIITSSLAFTRCCLNPILYAFVGVKFRKDILLMLKNIGCISRTRYIKHCGSGKSFSNHVAMDTSSFSL